MQELKILEEIDQEVKEYMEIDFGDEYNAGIKDMAKMAKKIVRKHMKNEEDRYFSGRMVGLLLFMNP